MNRERYWGLDLLKILATFMIIILHLLGFSGLLTPDGGSPIRYVTLWLLETACYGAVNCYGLISGYLSDQRKWHPAHLLKLWLQVAFYTFGTTLILSLTVPGVVGKRAWLDAITPILSKQYWYFSSYFVLFLFMPFLDRAIYGLSQRQLLQLCLSLILCFSLLPLVASGDVFALQSGYSPLWLMVLYLLGACLKTCKVSGRSVILFFSYTLCTLAAWVFKMLLSPPSINLTIPPFNSSLALSYLSPMILFGSMALVLLFSGLFPPPFLRRVATLLAPATFGVYLIHINPIIWEYILYPWVLRLSPLPLPTVLFAVFGEATLIYLLCSFLDLMRAALFRLCGADRVAGRLESRFREKILRR